jgi:hypothetical protein
MANKLAYQGEPRDFSFSIGGRVILVAPVTTPIPTDIVPILDDNIPSPWVSLGPTENSEATITLNQTTEIIVTGVVPTERRRVLTGQTGLIEATLMMNQASLYHRVFGINQIANTAAASANRAYGDLFFGGQLGAKFSVLVIEEFIDNLIEDDPVSGKTYEQIWSHSPGVIKDGDIEWRRVSRMYVPQFRAALQGFSNAGAPGLSLLLHQRWVEGA